MSGFVHNVQCCISVVAAAGEEGAAKLVNGKNAEPASHGLQKVNPTDAQNVRAQAQSVTTVICSLCPSSSVRPDDVKSSRVQETHPSPKTQRIAGEVCNHDPCSMIHDPIF